MSSTIHKTDKQNCSIIRISLKDIHKYNILEGISTWTLSENSMVLFCKEDIAYLDYEKGLVILKDGSSFGINEYSDTELFYNNHGFGSFPCKQKVPSISCNKKAFTIYHSEINSHEIDQIIERVLSGKNIVTKILFLLTIKRKQNMMIFTCFSRKLFKSIYIKFCNYRKDIISSNEEFEENLVLISKNMKKFVKKFNLI